MTEREKFRIKEIKGLVASRDHHTCQRCGGPGYELAHLIAKTRANIKKYGADVIHHPLNIRLSCSACNSSFNIGNKTRQADMLAAVIRGKLEAKHGPH